MSYIYNAPAARHRAEVPPHTPHHVLQNWLMLAVIAALTLLMLIFAAQRTQADTPGPVLEAQAATQAQLDAIAYNRAVRFNQSDRFSYTLYLDLRQADHARAVTDAGTWLSEVDAVKSLEVLSEDSALIAALDTRSQGLRRLAGSSVNLWSASELEWVTRDLRALTADIAPHVQAVKDAHARYDAEQARLEQVRMAQEREALRLSDRGSTRDPVAATAASTVNAAEAEAARLGVPLEWGNTLGHYGAYWPGSGVISIGTQVAGFSSSMQRAIVRHETAHLIIESRCGVYYPSTAQFERVAEAYADIYLGGLSWMNYGYNASDAEYAANVAKGTC